MDLSAGCFLIVLHAYRLCLCACVGVRVCEWVSAGPSGKHHVSQLCSTGCWDSLRCCLAPLRAGEVEEIKCNILDLILPNALWHPHSAETVAQPCLHKRAAATQTAIMPVDMCTSFTLTLWQRWDFYCLFAVLSLINHGDLSDTTKNMSCPCLALDKVLRTE